MKRTFAYILLILPYCAFCWSFSGESSRPMRRFLNEVLTTGDCPKKRLSYPLRMDASFLYTTTQNETTLDLKAMERAIATSVSSLLEACDADGRPLQVVELTDERRHEVISFEYVGDFCAQNDSCTLIRGITSILSAGDTATIQSDTKVLIESAFDDRDYLTLLANVGDVSLALFLGVNIVLPSFNEEILDEHSRTNQSQSLRIGAIVTIALVTLFALFFYVLSHKGDPGDGERKNRMLFLQAKRRRFFQDLDNQNSLPMGWMVLNANHQTAFPKDGNDPASMPKDGTTVTWSVSDLTSDAESIKSNLPLERIIEVEDEMSSDEGTVRDRSYAASSPIYSPRSPVKIADLEFIANWKEHFTDFSPTGAQDIVRDLNMMYNARTTVFWTEEETGQELSILSADDMELDGCDFAAESGDVENLALQVSDADDVTKYLTPTASQNHSAESD